MTNAERQKKYRDRKKAARNAPVTPTIPAEQPVTVAPGGIVYKEGHQFYAWADGTTYAIVRCGKVGCQRCGQT